MAESLIGEIMLLLLFLGLLLVGILFILLMRGNFLSATGSLASLL